MPVRAVAWLYGVYGLQAMTGIIGNLISYAGQDDDQKMVAAGFEIVRGSWSFRPPAHCLCAVQLYTAAATLASMKPMKMINATPRPYSSIDFNKGFRLQDAGRRIARNGRLSTSQQHSQ